MNFYSTSDIFPSSYEDQNSNSDDTDTEEQKMLELEAQLYSMVHYADDLSTLENDFKPIDQEKTSDPNENFDDAILTNFNGVNNQNTALEKENISTTIFNEIINAKKQTQRTASDLQSDSGMSCDQDVSYLPDSTENKTSEINASIIEALNDSNSSSIEDFNKSGATLFDPTKSDSKYTDHELSVKNKQNSKIKRDRSVNTTVEPHPITISSSDSETSSDEDSGIQVLKEVDKSNKPCPLVEIETDDSSDDTKHNKFLDGIKGMDENYTDNETTLKVKSSNTSSSDSEIELLPNTSNQFSSSIKRTSFHNSNIVPSSSPPSSSKKIETLDEVQCNSSQLKSKVTIVDHQDSRKKLTPKNIVHMSSNSDSSSSDEENILGNTSISLNVIGGRKNANTSSTGNIVSFDEIISQDDPLHANVREQCSMLSIKRDEVIVKNWTPEMYKFYNEINKSDANIDLEKIKQEMPDDPKLWRINSQDKYSSKESSLRKRYFSPRNQSIRCRNCNHNGHLAKDCKEKIRPTVCHMCGTEGHISDNCKDAKCLRCGLPNVYYSHTGCMHCRRLDKTNCNICGAKGHVKFTCPDMWRRFHATLSGEEGMVHEPFGGIDRTHKPLAQIWCCNCAKRGHYPHHCNAYNYSSYPKSVLHVINYTNINPDLDTSLFETSTPSISKNQKRKKEMRELKARKQAFRSLNNTPNTSRSYGESSTSMPVTPPLRSFDEEQEKVSYSLEKAKQSLEELMSMEDNCGSSSKKWRKRQRNKEKESKSKDYISINYNRKSQRKRSPNISHDWNEDNIFSHHKSKRLKKSLSKGEKDFNRSNPNAESSRKRKHSPKHHEDINSKSCNKNNMDLFYGTTSRPPNMMQRLSKVSKIKKNSKKNKDHGDARERYNTKASDKKLFKLINQSIGENKKSSHFALNQIVRNLRKKNKK